MTAKVQPRPVERASHDALVGAAATIAAALIGRADPSEEISREWITSAYALAYAAILMAPPQVEKEAQLALQSQ